MKKIMFAIVGILLIGSSSTPVIGFETTEELKVKMESSDGQVRETAINEFMYGTLGTVNGESQEASAIPVLTNALSDNNIKIREFAAACLLMISGESIRVITPARANLPDLTTYPAAQTALLNATSDPDELVRVTALKAYAFTYKLTPEIENKVIQEFNAPDTKANDAADKVALLEALMIAGSPSPHATEFLTKLLDDPKWAPHLAERMAADNCPLSGGALDKLAGKLTQETDPVNRAAYARAIGSYGKKAQPYAPQLKAALASEKDDVAKANIKAAIDKINQ